MKKTFTLILFLFLLNSGKALTVNGSFVQGTATLPEFINLTLVEHFDEIRFINGTKVLAKTRLKDDGTFSISVPDLSPENMLYRISFENDSLSISIRFGPENFILFWANNSSRIPIYSINLSSINPPLYDTLNADKINREIEKTSQLLNKYYISNMLDTAGKMSPEQLQSKRNYADLQAKAMMKEDFSIPSSLLALSFFSSEEDIFLDPAFYKHQVERLKIISAEHPYVIEISEFVKQNLRVKDAESDESESTALILSVSALVLVSMLLLYFISIRKRNKLQAPAEEKNLIAMVETLSIKERQIAKHIAEGKSNKEIADILSVELSTIKSHVSNIFSKLEISSRKEVLKFREIL